MFETWDREKVVKWVEHIEMEMVLGIASGANPDTGSVTYSSPKERTRILRLLKNRLCVIDGQPIVRTTRVTMMRPIYHLDD